METTGNQYRQAIERILEETTAHEMTELLWEMTVACLTTDAPPFNRADKRADALLNYQRISTVLAAGAQIVSAISEEHRAAAA